MQVDEGVQFAVMVIEFIAANPQPQRTVRFPAAVDINDARFELHRLRGRKPSDLQSFH
jgi:hypothetical protein